MADTAIGERCSAPASARRGGGRGLLTFIISKRARGRCSRHVCRGNEPSELCHRWPRHGPAALREIGGPLIHSHVAQLRAECRAGSRRAGLGAGSTQARLAGSERTRDRVEAFVTGNGLDRAAMSSAVRLPPVSPILPLI